MTTKQHTQPRPRSTAPAARARKFKAPTSPAEFRRRVRALLNRAGLRDVDPDLRAVFLDLLDILCDAFESGGMPEARRVWAEAKRVVFKRAPTKRAAGKASAGS